jgi:hypothetical protein
MFIIETTKKLFKKRNNLESGGSRANSDTMDFSRISNSMLKADHCHRIAVKTIGNRLVSCF